MSLKSCFRWYNILFIGILFSNYEIGSFLVSDIYYLLFSIFIVIKTKVGKMNIDHLYIYITFFLLLSIYNYYTYHHIKAFLSCLRFVYGFFISVLLIATLNKSKYRHIVINAYLDFCVFFSLFLLMQFLSYYLLHVKIDFSLGSNIRGSGYFSDLYDPRYDINYRTGGFFYEPSHYASFVSPSLFLLSRPMQKIKFILVFLGVLVSTSGLGYVILSLWGIWMCLKPGNFTLKVGLISIVVIAVSLMPFVFERVSSGGSYEVRIIEGWMILYDNATVSLWGIDPHIYMEDDGSRVFFANTFQYLYINYGIVGVLTFVMFTYYKRVPFVSLSIFAIIFIEGINGRIEFWLLLFVLYLYEKEKERQDRCPPRLLGDCRECRLVS